MLFTLEVGSLEGFYMFKHKSHPRRSRRDAVDLTWDLSDHPNVSNLLQLMKLLYCVFLYDESFHETEFMCILGRLGRPTDC